MASREDAHMGDAGAHTQSAYPRSQQRAELNALNVGQANYPVMGGMT